MLSRNQKHQLRSHIFKHLDGIVVAPTAFALYKKGVLKYILERKKVGLSELASVFHANEGYLNVAVRALASQGWLDYDIDTTGADITIERNAQTGIAFEYIPMYEKAVELMKFSGNFHPRKFEKEPFQKLNALFNEFYIRFNQTQPEEPEKARIFEQVLSHIEGLMVGPTIVLLGMGGMFHKYFMETSFKPEEYHKDPESFESILDFLTFLGWFHKKNDTYQFTETGLFFAKRASAYGVTVSYIPTLRQLDALLFGNPNILKTTSPHEPEKHVDREMNVWGSGGAHAVYFDKIDEIIIDIFNQEPIEEQPKGILDMGCGNGAFLIHLFNVIEKNTLRGKVLDAHPLFLVGADYNETALKVTRANIIQADIWAKVIWGDIGNPARLNKDLEEDYNIRLQDLLNVRTFLDHNRIWAPPSKSPVKMITASTGAFASSGKRLLNAEVVQSLIEHLESWKPYIAKYGLLIIELHTLPPQTTAKNIGNTAATAYDVTHGYSDQYIVEINVFEEAITKAGLELVKKYSTRFPDSDLANISINLLKGIS